MQKKGGGGYLCEKEDMARPSRVSSGLINWHTTGGIVEAPSATSEVGCDTPSDATYFVTFVLFGSSGGDGLCSTEWLTLINPKVTKSLSSQTHPRLCQPNLCFHRM